MLKHSDFRRRGLGALAVFLCFALTAFAATYNAQSDFSSTQGYQNWYYQEWTGSAYQNMTWDTDHWQGSYTWCRLYNNWGHPQTNQPARKWVAPSAGKIRITGSTYDINGGGGDGVIVRIYKNNRLLWYAVINNDDTTGHDFDLETNVESGDAIYFRIDEGANYGYDATRFAPTIEHTPSESVDSLRPHGATLAGTNSASYAGGVYSFNFSDGSDNRTYQVDINNASVQAGLIRIYETQSQSYPIHYGGTRYRKLDGSVIAPYQLASSATVTMLSHSLSGNKLTIQYRDVYEGVTNEKTVTYEIKGKTMIINVASDTDRVSADGNYTGFAFDRSESTSNPEAVYVPFMHPVPIVMVNTSYFYSTYLDKSLSTGTNFLEQGPSAYSGTSFWCSPYSEMTPNSADEVMPMNETAYLTVSADVTDTLPSPDHDASDYRSDLDDRVVFDLWMNSFSTAQSKIQQAYSYGMADVLVLYHAWQYYGYDQGMPKHYPAGAQYGGPTACANMVNAALGYGWLFALHEDYWFMDSNTGYPYWDPDALAKDPNFSYRNAWYDPNTQQQQYAIASDKMLGFSETESNLVKNNYATNAMYLDVNTGYDPERVLHQLDFDAYNPNSRTLGQAIYNCKRLYDNLHDVFEGPLLGEAAGDGAPEYEFSRHDSFYAGYVDGVERQIEDMEDADIMPDFELKIVKPLMANHGNGYYSRYFQRFRRSRASHVRHDGQVPRHRDSLRARRLRRHQPLLGTTTSGPKSVRNTT